MKKKMKFRTIFIVGILGLIMAFAPLTFADNKKVTADIKKKMETIGKDQTTEKRKTLLKEATDAIRETKNAIKALDDNNAKEALAALERASGKLTIILGREPDLALAPSDINVVTYDILADIAAVKTLRSAIEDAMDKGRVQQARRLIKDLASELVISVTNIPLATYPDVIKTAAKLVDDSKIEEAKNALQVALNTLVITDTIIPLPVITAEIFLQETEVLAEKKNRTAEENERLVKFLKDARQELKFAQVLGYGNKKDFKNLYEQLDQIEKKTEDGKSGISFFDKIKIFLKDVVKSSQGDGKSNKAE